MSRVVGLRVEEGEGSIGANPQVWLPGDGNIDHTTRWPPAFHQFKIDMS